MVKCFEDLSATFPNMHHVTCLAHAFNRVCDKVKDEHPLVNSFLGTTKTVFTRSSERVELWKDVTGEIIYINCIKKNYQN